ncbi:uncharacterized protein Z519_01929 [Cladophialophora bantiana CBS 173.52]|uniref:Mediator of RNA polymerase II transcription subunit 5 n=1 Tax=Cladophialophora bantiana (strain ATCC 10958 / CBS 173.52 / CDC B-1940 / NIH 8579) TaxID=1442370 RepID=A0A0D2HSV9_CLAB1|nr:uncharacterized protein Z519_01929 [Cladophialophora bantiana CBS 173.52]KIW96538.1 hypothetical protein Z519_01929 [Cladophialophora bantiana CBS 173.52]
MTVSRWMTLARQCLLRRISVQQFSDLLRSYVNEIDGKRLFIGLLECRDFFCQPGDPLISLYVDYIAITGIIAISDALIILTKRWNDTKFPASRDTLVCYNDTLQDLNMVVVSPKYKTTASEARLALQISSRWLSALARQASQGDPEPSGLELNGTIELLAFLMASMAATDAGLEALSPHGGLRQKNKQGPPKDLGISVKQAFELCLPLYSMLSPQLMERINTVLKHIKLLDDSPSQLDNARAPTSEIQALQFQVTIAESQLVASKAGTMLYLESLLFTGSTIDDGGTVHWLSSRHQNDYQSMFSDIFTSSFSILKAQNTIPARTLCLQQSQIFIQNKLPALLSMISASSFNSFSTEQAITEAWHQVVPLLSTQDLLLTGARFLHVCSLHHLIPAQVAAQLVGSEDLLKGLSKGLYAKDDLVAQVNMNHIRGPKLVEELTRNDGSAGFISQAVVEIMHIYCQNKETQYLRDLANAILRRPAAINCIALFVRPSFFLGPLCGLLDEWRWDEIHEGEAQPVYDDFGAIFLLILISRARLALPNSSLGIRKKDGFLAQYLEQENNEESLESLSEEKRSHLGNWINALYLAEGLSDELFTNCSPHDFYLLIPTLLRQSMTAYQQGKLTHDSLQAGLDYLLEPFLLPSLISAMNWVAEVFRDEPTVAGKVLEVLIKPPGSVESRDIHHTILAMCAPRLKMRLKAAGSKDTNADPILKILDQCPGFSLFSERELEIPGPGVLDILQHSLVTLITSTTTLDYGDQIASRDISALVNRAVEVRGPHTTLRAIVGVLLQLSDNHAFLFALDALTTTVCMAGNGLRDALRLQYNDLGGILKRGETLNAEGVVRLHRQVEAYTNLLAVPEMGLDSFTFTQQLTNMDTANPNLDAGTAVSGGMDIQTEQGQVDGIDQVLDEVAAMGNLDSNDADMSFDALYGLQGNDMDLNDLDLDNMF